jgi:uncharacterized membrane protein
VNAKHERAIHWIARLVLVEVLSCAVEVYTARRKSTNDYQLVSEPVAQ